MNEPQKTYNLLKDAARRAGACAFGVAKAQPVPPDEWAKFEHWLELGMNAGMEYMKNYPEIRRDPRLLLENAKSVIALAFSYHPREFRNPNQGIISAYAYGKDYHKFLRKRLKAALSEISKTLPQATFRICIDSAPILERYWAEKAGIGIRGWNGAIIVPNFGSFVILAEIITNLELPADTPAAGKCKECGACLKACPGGALSPQGLNCNRCLSYITIEHRGDLTPEATEVLATPIGRKTIFGCDACLRVCPHNRTAPPTVLPEFAPLPILQDLTLTSLPTLPPETYRSLFAGSPLARRYPSHLLP